MPGASLLRADAGAWAQEVEEAAMWSTIRWGERHPRGLQLPPRLLPEALDAAYKRCGVITADYAKTFYLVRAHERRRVQVRALGCGLEAGAAGVPTCLAGCVSSAAVESPSTPGARGFMTRC